MGGRQKWLRISSSGRHWYQCIESSSSVITLLESGRRTVVQNTMMRRVYKFLAEKPFSVKYILILHKKKH
jgi:hypothetical protein